jgi:hypothetical protein
MMFANLGWRRVCRLLNTRVKNRKEWLWDEMLPFWVSFQSYR